MSRIHQIAPEAATGKAKELLDAVQGKLGLVPNITRAMANSPSVLEGYLGLSGAFGKGGLSAKNREQIALAVGQANLNLDQPTIVYGSGRRPDAAIPRPGLRLRKGHVGIVVTDPQNDFLSPHGVSWSVVGQNVTANRTVENIGQLFAVAKEFDIPLFISPHYYFPHDHQWKFEGALERLMHDIKMFDRPGPLDTTGLNGSGADWLEQYKPFINDGQTIVCSPHKVFGPQSNDLVLQLRKRRVEQVILAGMSANLCVESHLRELLEQGFDVAVVGDATAAAQVPGYDGYEAAITNFRFLASDLWSMLLGTARRIVPMKLWRRTMQRLNSVNRSLLRPLSRLLFNRVLGLLQASGFSSITAD